MRRNEQDDSAFAQNGFGLTKREYFVAQIINGITANMQFDKIDISTCTKLAIQIADDLLEKL